MLDSRNRSHSDCSGTEKNPKKGLENCGYLRTKVVMARYCFSLPFQMVIRPGRMLRSWIPADSVTRFYKFHSLMTVVTLDASPGSAGSDAFIA